MSNQTGTWAGSYDLSTLDQIALTPIVRLALESETAELLNWSCDRVYGGAGQVGAVLSGVYRFAGKARDQDRTIDWSLVLKVVGTKATNDDPSEPRYWKREVLAYQSGQLVDLPGGLAAPRFFGTVEFSEQVVGLWLENIVDRVGPRWPLQHYGLVARHLGQFNGAFLAEPELPSWPWLSQGWLREHVSRAAPNFAHLSRSLDQPLTRRWFIGDDAHRLLRLWEERQLFLDALDRLPQTLLHRDAFRRNLFARHTKEGDDQTVAVDWTYVGIGAIGEELAPLVHASLYFSEVDKTKARKLDRIVFDEYLEGLDEAGWRGDPRLVRLGYTAGSALSYGLGYGVCAPDESRFPRFEQMLGLPIDEVMGLAAEMQHFLLELADEARTLLGVI